MVIQHKCPNCGADMVFHAETGLLSCESCGHTQEIDSMENSAANYEDFVKQTSSQTYTDDSAAQYQCKNCGAILITNEDTTATTCSFCDSPMILGDRLTGELAPSKVAPFSITKQQAEEAFKKWCGKGLLLPNDFKKANRVKSITGMYVPFWLFDMHTQGEIHAECTKVKHRTEGEYEVTETSYFDVFRSADLYFNKIPVDASAKMDDDMMDKLEPFDYENLHDFNTPYLSGYLAEKYDYTDKELYPRVEERSDDYTVDYLRSTILGYDSTRILHKDIHAQPLDAQYTLLPVWLFCYDYQNGEHNFMMNGQTGKIVGKPPLSKKKATGFFFLFTLLAFFILKLIAFAYGGVWF